MKPLYKSFLKQLVIYTLVLMLAGLGLTYFLSPTYVTPALPFLIVLFMVVTAIVHYILLKALADRPGKFVSSFLLTTTLKLMLYLGVVLVYSFLNPSGVIAFAIAFFVLYILYTVFEILSVLPVAKNKNN